MPFSFPQNPSLGDLSTQNGRQFRYAGNSTWELVAASGLSWSSVPASATASGTAGQIAYDSVNGFFYVATATNTWRRAALSTWLPFAPTDIAGLQLWLDASDASTLFDATTGGSLVAADGGVARWEDKSGNNRHATQSQSANRPTRKTAVQSGKDVMRFDGSNDFLEGSVTPGDGNTRSVFVVAKLSAAFGELFQIGRATSGQSLQGFMVRAGSISGTYYVGGDVTVNNLALASGSAPVSTFFLAALIQQSTTSIGYYHNSINYSIAGTLASFASPTPGYFVGKARNDAADLTLWTGDVCEIIVYDTALSSGDRSAVESYLIGKWGTNAPAITISSQPSNQTASSGSATFSATASVTQGGSLTYQWQRSTNSGSTWADVSGATSSSLVLSSQTSGNNGDQYRVIVSSVGASSVTSSAATLTVTAAAAITYANKYGSFAHSVTGTSTVTANLTGTGYASADTRLWLLVGTTGTLSYTVTASSQAGFDIGRLFVSSSSPASNAALTAVSGEVSGTQTSSGTLSVTAGQHLVLVYTKDSEDSELNDRITAVLSIA